jgi:hypothetical protein
MPNQNLALSNRFIHTITVRGYVNPINHDGRDLVGVLAERYKDAGRDNLEEVQNFIDVHLPAILEELGSNPRTEDIIEKLIERSPFREE